MRKERCLSRARLLSWLRPHEGDVVFNGTGRLVVPKLKFRTLRWSVGPLIKNESRGIERELKAH